MKIVIAPDSFKGSVSSVDAAELIRRGAAEVVDAQYTTLPVADGGEGTLDAIVSSANGDVKTVKVCGPLHGGQVDAKIGFIGGGVAVIELAQAAGLTLLPRESLNPMHTTTYGVGQMMRYALECGCRKIIIGVGGSCTNDGGAGLAQALGVSFMDCCGNQLQYGGGALNQLASIDVSGMDKRIRGVETGMETGMETTEIIIASDVDNPLCGENGASYVYGPQKGASPQMVRQLDSNLKHYADIVRRQLGIDVQNMRGSGAAGGVVAALTAFCGATVRSGAGVVLDAIDFDRHISDADLIITGEGKIDAQTANGKLLSVMAARAKTAGVPIFAVVGGMEGDVSALYDMGLTSVFSIVNSPMTLDDAMRDVTRLLPDAVKRMMLIFKAGRR